ncbi:MAG: glycoside hydrolase [Actinomycetota bacterium]|nr:glycoside hydrolase [Actinomycetota bacterium]
MGVSRGALSVALAGLLAASCSPAGDIRGRAAKASKGSLVTGVIPFRTASRGAEADPRGRLGSGGRAIAHLAGGVEIVDRAVAAKAPRARLFRTGAAAFEPTMGITENGAIFFDSLSDSSSPQVSRSTDGGKSWQTVFAGHPTTADPYLYVDPLTSRIFSNDLIPPCHLVSFSDDDGATWTSAPPAGCITNQDHQTIFAGPPPKGGQKPAGYPNVVYLCSIGVGISLAAAGSVCSKSLDGGTTYIPAGLAFYDDPRLSGDYGVPGRCHGAHGHGAVGPDGTVYLPRGWCGQPWLGISRDEGTTWTRVQVADNGMACCGRLLGESGVEPGEALFSHEAGIDIDAAGNLYYTWVARDRLPYLAISRDGGKTWADPMMIGPPGLKESLLPGIDVGAPGKLVVHYMGSTNSPWRGPGTSGSDQDTRWNGYLTMTVNALAPRPVFYSATENDPKEPLWVGSCGPDPERCSWGDFFDVVIGVDGRPWSIAVDLCRDRDAKCDDASYGEGIVGHLVGGPRLDKRR